MLKQVLFIGLLVLATVAKAQVKIGNNPGSIEATAVLELESSTQGVLLPRMTETQRDAISSPAAGLWIFNTTRKRTEWYDGSRWTDVEDQKAYGSISLDGNTTQTVVTTAGTYYQAAGTYNFSAVNNDFEMSTNGQLRYIGLKTKHFHIVCNISMNSLGTGSTIGGSVTLNGTPTGIEMRRKLGGAGDFGAFAVHVDYDLSTGDYISFQARNTTSTDNLLIKHLYLFAMSTD